MGFNTDAEKRGGYLVSHEMKKVWAVELDLLRQLIEVCQRENLRMWVDGGTLLGAVRHQGFIPWDDDIDVCMPRPDYDRLTAISGQVFKEPYFYQNAYTDKDYFAGHAQLRNSRTAAIRPSASFNPFNQGIFIDIFVLDGVPEEETERRRVWKASRRMQHFLKAKNLNILISGRWLQVFRKIQSRRAVSKTGWTSLYRQAEDQLRLASFDESKEVAEISFSAYDIVLDRHIFDDTVWLDFEDMKVPAPSGYDQLLRTQYGENYMTPIQTGNYHGELVFDTERSYVELLPEVRLRYKKSQIAKLFGKKK
ncbi:lipopolysaccharide cholinephosphotransferase [Prevotella sp. khp7]|uniref:LicD family protein n=1 Tax=Prevotella sp. khp7 TaxID=1761885 RepID=UPI0008CE99C3|nr:LicD family protein [Prevotella sp. khp7]SEW03062.1 lipopolysaccharide cholinephosphotransferase [Prevotella sp. khp7]